MRRIQIERQHLVGGALAAGACLLAFMFQGMGLLESFELKTFDWRLALSGGAVPHPKAVLAEIDSRLPLSGSIHARFIEASQYFGASRVVYTTPFNMTEDRDSRDKIMEAAARAGNVYFPLKFYPASGAEILTADPGADSMAGLYALPQRASPGSQGVYRAAALLNEPPPGSTGFLRGMGFINTRRDRDGALRRIPAVLYYHGNYFLQLGLLALAGQMGISADKIEFHPGRRLLFRSMPEKDRPAGRELSIPLDRDGNLIIHWVGKPEAVRRISYKDLILSYYKARSGKPTTIPAEQLKALSGAIIIAGPTGNAAPESFPSPAGKHTSVAELNYHAVNAVLQHDFIRRSSGLTDLIIVYSACLLLSFLLPFFPRHYAPAFTSGVVLALLAFSFTVFSAAGLWLNTAAPVLAACLTGLLSEGYRFSLSLHSHKRMMKTSRMQITRGKLEQMLEHPEQLKLGGEKRRLTIMVIDLRGHIVFTEKLPAEQTVSVLNEYLALCASIISRHQGAVDQLVGNEILAYFGVPHVAGLHARNAIHAAVEIKNEMEKLKEKWRSEGKPEFSPGIGIHTGNAMIGNIGTRNTLNFTLVGDDVNLGARLCTRADAGEILISESTYRDVSAHVEIVTTEMTRIQKGKAPVQVFSVMNFIADLEKERRRFKRMEVRIKVLLRTPSMKGKHIVVMVNVSAGGFRMEGPLSIPAGTVVTVIIPLPNNMILEDLKAEILESSKTGQGKWMSRGRFVDLPFWARDELTKLVYFGDKKTE